MTSRVLPSFSASLQGRKTGSGQCTVSQIDVSLLLQIFKCQPVTCQLSLHVLWKPGAIGWHEGGSEGKSRLEPKEDTRGSPGSQQTWQQEIKLYFRTEISEFLCHCSITYPMLIKQQTRILHSQTRNQIFTTQMFCGTQGHTHTHKTPHHLSRKLVGERAPSNQVSKLRDRKQATPLKRGKEPLGWWYT